MNAPYISFLILTLLAKVIGAIIVSFCLLLLIAVGVTTYALEKERKYNLKQQLADLVKDVEAHPENYPIINNTIRNGK